MENKETPELLLGKSTEYPTSYNKSLLTPIPRVRQNSMPAFKGSDFWTAYEFSWIGENLKPRNAILHIELPASSPNIVESKSLKLYLNGFVGEQFEESSELLKVLQSDLTECVGASLKLEMKSLKTLESERFTSLDGVNLDDIAPLALDSEPDTSRINSSSLKGSFSYHTTLFRSLCPVTGQPDWADIQVDIVGAELDLQGLQTYLLGYRQHRGFHEQCIEQIYSDIWNRVRPEQLEVSGRFLRRGGIDINPFRSSKRDKPAGFGRTSRQ